MKSVAQQSISELRQDIVSGDWVVIATGRAKRPYAFIREKKERWYQSKSNCPFENPQMSGNEKPLFVLPKSRLIKDWWLQVVPNKFPAFGPSRLCPPETRYGPYTRMDGIGFHEVIITRDHNRSIALFSQDEAECVIRAYRERYLALMNQNCVRYISIFHNSGKGAGATIYHPHSQLIAIPVIPGDVWDSLHGAKKFFRKYKRCAHCKMIDWDLKTRERIVYENESFITVCPYTSRSAFSMVISPKTHSVCFEMTSETDLKLLAEALRISLKKLYKGLKDPAYNYFIHTVPSKGETDYHFYHWHLEIIPKTTIWAGFEIGTGIEISSIRPEDAAAFLRKQK